MKKTHLSLHKFLIASVVALLATTSAFAISKGPADTKHEACDVTPGPFAFCYPKDIGLSCPNDFYVHGDYLLMQAQEEGLDYAMSQSNYNAGWPELLPYDGSIIGFSTGSKNWDWNSGFRVGFGAYLNDDEWNLDMEWTYLRIREDSSANIPGGTMVPLWVFGGYPILNVYINNNASARWTGKFNTLDFALGKPFHTSRYFVFNPFFGLRAAWIDQNLTARYGGINYIGQDGIKVYSKNDFWGVGFKAGFNGEFLLGAGWSLFGLFSSSVLFGKYDLNQQMNLTGEQGNFDYNVSHDFYATAPNLNIALGISWGHFFSQKTWYMGLKVGYEFHQWFHQNNLRRFLHYYVASNNPVSRGDLSFNGFSFRLQFDF